MSEPNQSQTLDGAIPIPKQIESATLAECKAVAKSDDVLAIIAPSIANMNGILSEFDVVFSDIQECWMEAQSSDKPKWTRRLDSLLDVRLRIMFIRDELSMNIHTVLNMSEPNQSQTLDGAIPIPKQTESATLAECKAVAKSADVLAIIAPSIVDMNRILREFDVVFSDIHECWMEAQSSDKPKWTRRLDSLLHVRLRIMFMRDELSMNIRTVLNRQ